ncbi:MAG: homocysteine S-methyltransferase family protein [Gemmatimonadota bacterium]|nr:MAG: homocysteine S-methyltransferase family protein [Gemmatimonadota bacterium]
MSESFLDALKVRVLLADGAVGTELQKGELEPGGCGERWNVEHPDRILAIQRAYAEAGADCLTTNTLGASRVMLEMHGIADDAEAIVRAGVRIAREAFGGRPGFVLGDMGPLGRLLEPLGDLSEAEAQGALSEQAATLIDEGVDAIIIETESSLGELGIAIAAAREAGAPCVIGSMAFDVIRDGADLRTMMGVSPEDGARFMTDAGADVLGLNCGKGIDAAWAATAVRRYASVSDLPTMAQPNAGLPVLENMRAVYKQGPEIMAEALPELLAAGVRVLGGCCGTTPDHIRHFRAMVDSWNAGPG